MTSKEITRNNITAFIARAINQASANAVDAEFGPSLATSPTATEGRPMPVLETYERTTIRFEAIDTSTPPDPFGLDDTCPHNAGGPHLFTAICDEIICPLCAKVVWQ